MVFNCKLCGSELVSESKQYKFVNKLFVGRRLTTCACCDGKQLDPMITLEEARKYNRDYWKKTSAWMNSPKEKRMWVKHKVLAKSKAKFLVENCSIISSVLEIGSGKGFLLDELRKSFPTVKLTSVEIDLGMRQELLNKNIGTYADWRIIGTRVRYDLIVLSHVLEHMIDPKGFLQWAKKVLKKNGKVFIDVPNSDDSFRVIHEPHLFVFNKRSMGRLITETNFELVSLKLFGRTLVNIKRDFECKRHRILTVRYYYWHVRFLLNKEKAISDYYQLEEEGVGRCWMRVLLG